MFLYFRNFVDQTEKKNGMKSSKVFEKVRFRFRILRICLDIMGVTESSLLPKLIHNSGIFAGRVNLSGLGS